MSKVFADTVGLIALWDRSDQWHASAEAVFSELVLEKAELVTTSCILLECGNSAARRPYRIEVDRLRSALQEGGYLIHPSDEDWRLGWEAYNRGGSDDAGIVDHLSFQVMRRLGIRRAFTNDRHFRAAGFEVMF